jgi:hypothetical protein
MNAPAELRDRYREGRLVPFIGAGISMAVTWTEGGIGRRGPSWRELVDEACKQLGFVDPDLLRVRGTDLQILEYFKLEKYGIQPLANWLYAEMRPPDDALRNSVVHQRLAALDRCDLFYTTNYDNFLERSFSLFGRAYRTISVEADIGRSTGAPACEIVKFHGDLNHPETIVLSESDYERRLSLSTPMDYRLRSDMLGRALLFLGYSFRDWNVSYLFRLINEQFNNRPGALTGRRAFIAVPEPSEFEIRLFRERNIEVIPVSASTTADDIAVLLADLQR